MPCGGFNTDQYEATRACCHGPLRIALGMGVDVWGFCAAAGTLFCEAQASCCACRECAGRLRLAACACGRCGEGSKRPASKRAPVAAAQDLRTTV